MADYICKLNNGKTKAVFPRCNIGDYVEVFDPGHQYTTYQDAFDYFWGGEAPYHIPYDDDNEERPKVWKVINMACHCDLGADVLYHIRTVDGKNALVNGGAIRPLHRHERNRVHVHDIMIYQLPHYTHKDDSSLLDDDGNVIKHDWKEKLYEILK